MRILFVLTVCLFLGGVHGASSDGAMWGAVIQRTGDYATPGIISPPSTLWTQDLGSIVASAPAPTAAAVYVGTTNGMLFALSNDTGAILWQLQLDQPLHSSPAVDEMEGRLFVGAGNVLYAINAADGSLIWTHATTGFVLASPAVYNDVVYASSVDGQILALSGPEGTPIWITNTPSGFISSPALGTGEGLLFTTGLDGVLRAFDLGNGNPVWTFSTGTPFLSSPTVDAGRLFISEGRGRVMALDSTDGTPLWEVTGEGGLIPSPSAAHGQIYVSLAPATLSALDPATGQEIWRAALNAPLFARSVSTTDVNTFQDAVYIATADGVIQGLNPVNGQTFWEIDVLGGVISHPSLLGGALFFGTDIGLLYALQ